MLDKKQGLVLHTRVRTKTIPIWAVEPSGNEIEVPVGSCGVVVEIRSGDDALCIVRWDDAQLGTSLFNEPLKACEVNY